jgi:prevent-host-death family protein
MCYMGETKESRNRVGVRELRQNLSVYLRRVKAGETLEVTERGQAVARLTPQPTHRLSPLQELIAQGRASAPIADIRSIPPPQKIPGVSVSNVLQEMRDEDDR